MVAKENGITAILVTTFVILILGAALIGTISKEANTAVDKTRASEDFTVLHEGTTPEINESVIYEVAEAPTGWELADCPLTSFTLENSSGVALVLNTDYIYSAKYGNFSILNTSSTSTAPNDGSETYLWDNSTTARYSYCADSYLNSAFGRTVLPLVGGFFALAILGVGIGIFFQIGKKTGLI